jgi:hypothetical protein
MPQGASVPNFSRRPREATPSAISTSFVIALENYILCFLNCAGLLVSNTSTALNLVVGEGATPTWETGGHYSDEQMYVTGSTPNNPISTTGTSDLFSGSTGTLSTTTPSSFKLYIDNVASSTLYKIMTFQGFWKGSSIGLTGVSGWGFWNNDTNAVTGLELFASGGGTISSGTCSLYGMN